VIAYGQEGLKWPVNTMEMVHNTVVSTFPGGSFIAAHNSTQSVRLVANLFAGTNSPRLLTGGVPSGQVTQQNTVIGSAANVPGATDLARPNFWPDATLRAQLSLGGTPDAGYTRDAPQPHALRALAPGPRLAGALQSSP